MALELEPLLAPLPGDDPAGPDLSYDTERYEIEQAFERPDASEDGAGEPDVNWPSMVRRITAQAETTRDIWLAVYLCRAGVLSGELETVEEGAQYLAALAERFWDDMHPKLDEYGFQGRKGPCESLVAYGSFLNPLRQVILLQHPRLGRYSGEDFERFRQHAEEEDGYGLFRAALEGVGEEGLLEAVGRLERIEDGLRRADAVMTARAEGDTSTNFQPTYDSLAALKRGVLAFTTNPEPLVDATGDDAADEELFQGGEAPARAAGGGGPRIAGRVESREDVLKALDAVSDYYRRAEPGSPVMLLLQRARGWVGLDFLAVLDDIAPDSLTDAKRVLVSRSEENSGSSW